MIISIFDTMLGQRVYLFFSVLLILGVCPYDSMSQCMTPFGTSFTSKTKTSVDFRWTDPNNAPLGWDVEVVVKGNPATGIPHNTNPILTKQYSIPDLQPSTFYEIYIRTLCSTNQKSAWNGPFVVSTVLENPTACNVDLDIKDNGTETFLVDVAAQGILGQDIFIESVDLIVDHEWPADLMISLSNPAGTSVKLTRYHGSGGKNLGIPDDVLCFQSTKFTDQACIPFQESQPPFNGSFVPAESLSGLYDQSEASGNWKLIFHDRATFHRGKLLFAQINFTTENCILPTNFYISEINNNSMVVDWESVPSCQSIKITIKEVGKPADQERVFFLNCLDESFRIPDLNPETEYEIFYQSVCGSILSTSSCIQIIKTTCKPTTLSESFDSQSRCLPSCQFACSLQGIWQNDEENIQNWTIWDKETDTENTGPSSDLSGEGQYIYTESQPGLCGIQPVILKSSCIQVVSNGDGCDAAFHYHMSGSGIGTLQLEVSRDGGVTWEELWQRSGHQGNSWQRVLLSLEDYANEVVLFRFVAYPTQSIYGDIGLDLIEFYGSHPMEGQFTYYRDLDEDTYGSNHDSIVICRSSPPVGYVSQSGDCFDDDAAINPGAEEVTCNLIDENCNGLEDDQNPASDLTYQVQVTNESCRGQKNGSIDIIISGGLPPYRVLWNTGETNSTLNGIGEGNYICTITDATSCSILSEIIPVFSQQQLQVIITNSTKPSCLGLNDGAINVSHSGGQSPFTYQWSDGNTTKDLTNVPEGMYQLTVTDINGCQVISPTFHLLSNPGITAGPVRIKHPTCHESKNGEIELGVISGFPPFQYAWQGGHDQNILNQIGTGFYTCTVSDSRGCLAKVQVELTAPDTMETVVLTIEPARCHGEKNGIIKTNSTGGTPPYLYFWSNGSFDDDIFNLTAGLYSLTVTDKNGCKSGLTNIEVPQPEPLTSTVLDVVSSRCILGENGSIELSTKGGSPPYHYSWNVNSAPDSSVLKDVRFGVYSVIVFDELGCKFSLGSILLPYVNVPLLVDLKVTQKNDCFGEMDGQIIATTREGNSPFDYNWSSGLQHVITSENDTLHNLSSGTYSVTVTDREGCVGTAEEVNIPIVPPLLYVVSAIGQNTCKEDEEGFIHLQIQNNQGPAQLFWNTGQSGFHIENLTNGFYSGEVVDSIGCRLQIPPLEISSTSNLQLDTSIIHTSSGQENGKACIVVNGASGVYTIQWGEGVQTFSGNCASQLAPGTYEVTITDSAGCQETIFFTILESVKTQDNAQARDVLYPNPAHDYFYCSPILQYSSLEIFDTQGNLILTKPSGMPCENLAIHSLSSGIFLVCYHYGGRYTCQKLVKL